ncbi:hypothetical protein D8O27_27955 [Burkholderia mallei]|uniref:Uncharacterized protein n=2 Tax=Burkholderia mallei TaxID=13373 RepID=A0AAX1X7X8_BURML|nr:hypothetical protein BMA2910 [Burkholderia mallei ATCC 23344]EDK54462.1 conserved hypothetical protein [Burkholderia mallei FMH]EDO89687.1 conserved hypothetical protein [Burkholderia pseudomallei Pasteur 52237]MBM5692193.1 hypothetical protein [Burkholderia pseudomallei]PNW99447.1 hypothetical protein CF649_24325 [Burkholderia sp. 136(2017)]PNX12395.1 hypothetical protein CF650_24945 [Burkholderia sp. 129]PNX26743.1 hypothetical protein CF647_23920 [Burkholderia sp. 117]PNX35469.1 hypoth
MVFHAHWAALYINENGSFKNGGLGRLILSMIETIGIEPVRAASASRGQYNRGF